LAGEPLREVLKALRASADPLRPAYAIALLGPCLSGKSAFLKQIEASLNRRRDQRTPVPIPIDLTDVGYGHEQQLSALVIQRLTGQLLMRGCLREADLDTNHDRVDRFLSGVAQRVDRPVALLVDHLDSVPAAFSRSFLRCCRAVFEQRARLRGGTQLRMVLAGSSSLFAMRRMGDSAFITNVVTFPIEGPMFARRRAPA
jgi:hypothetical protein